MMVNPLRCVTIMIRVSIYMWSIKSQKNSDCLIPLPPPPLPPCVVLFTVSLVRIRSQSAAVKQFMFKTIPSLVTGSQTVAKEQY